MTSDCDATPAPVLLSRPVSRLWARLSALWRRSGGGLPTTRAGAEWAVMMTFVLWRLGTLVFIGLALPTAVQRSTTAWINIALVCLVLAESIIRIVVAIRARTCLSVRWTAVDVLLAMVCLLAQPLYVPTGDLVGTWTGWAPGFAVNAAICVGAGVATRRQTLVLSLVLALTYFVASAEAIGDEAVLSTVLVNVATYPVFALLCRAMASTVRRFGADADAARQAAAAASRQLEAERSRRLLHDQASLLTYLADPDLDPTLAETVRAQALAEANRIRAYLSRPVADLTLAGAAVARNGSLVAAVRKAAAGFTDLPVEVLLDLADEVELPVATTDVVTAATSTVLHNVRHHAGRGARVVVHGDYLAAEGEWELIIRDDGRGFDPAFTALGYGLTQVAGQALAEHGITRTVDSRPGGGTAVTIRGRYPL